MLLWIEIGKERRWGSRKYFLLFYSREAINLFSSVVKITFYTILVAFQLFSFHFLNECHCVIVFSWQSQLLCPLKGPKRQRPGCCHAKTTSHKCSVPLFSFLRAQSEIERLVMSKACKNWPELQLKTNRNEKKSENMT